MANKNLIKRAFSVTANLPSQRVDALHLAPVESPVAAVPVEPASAEEVGAPAAPTPAASVSESLPVVRPVVAPRTSPGSMLAFMAEQSEVHKEVVELRQRLEAFDGAEITRRLDPRHVVASKWANRNAAHFTSEAFASLKAEIESAGGNIQPIKVRAISAAVPDAPRFELVYGHRRHRACLELGLPVLALVEEGMKDAQLFIEMDRENRERADLSPWEQGVMYARALDEGLFPSGKQLAAALGVDMGAVSKARSLSSLPQEVVAAFMSPLDLQFRWGKPLTEALQKDPEGVLERARAMAAQEPRPASADVFKMLIQTPGVKPRRAGAAEWLDGQGRRVASMSTDRKGRATILLEGLDETQQRRLVKLLDGFLGLKAA
ncbi:ParB/RepB/Spo0J family partition protein [Variovorax sp. E3]|uniref:ParB/RepB/Spo0J family partition protein n=1 Tax=Variovorax sp. E3 TaxID=1914993 RepID=UPI0018DCE66E|nr:ParB/RepB/Spo0J family partition protein [Variovorax sp. E3]